TPVRVGDLSVYLTALGTVTPLNTVTVKSRVDGQLMATHFTEGQVVHAGDVLAEIDPRPYQAQLTQAEGQLARDQANLANTRLDLERYQRLAQQEMIAQQQLDTQRVIDNQIDPATGTVRLKASFGNTDGVLYPNQFVNARVLIDVLHDAVLAPAEAIQRGPQGAYVYVVTPDTIVQMRRVQLGPSEAGVVAVRAGVADGEALVVDG